VWFLGHFAVGYFVAYSISQFTREKINLPLVLGFAMLPDIDVLIPGLIHRSVTHSAILALLLFVPILLIAKSGFSYLGALLTHSLIGDYFTGTPFQLFWPISNTFFESPIFKLYGMVEIMVEVGLFLIFTLFILHLAGKHHLNLSKLLFTLI
jgi:membrane-bound metal-dependent hydrolase YbcI (DUF457 family)